MSDLFQEFLRQAPNVRLAILFVAGAIVGTLINIWVQRAGFSSPPSAPQGWWRRLPIVGNLVRSRSADSAGWGREALVELLTGGIFAGLYWWEVLRMGMVIPPLPAGAFPLGSLIFTLHVQYGVHLLLAALMIAATVTDLLEQVIPDSITVPGAVLAILIATVYPKSLPMDTLVSNVQRVDYLTLSFTREWPPILEWGQREGLAVALACFWLWCFALLPRRWRGEVGWSAAMLLLVRRWRRQKLSWWVWALGALGTVWIVLIWRLGLPHWHGLMTSLVGMAAGACLIWAVRLICSPIMDQEAMGFGDVTLMAMIGAFLGWQICLFVFFSAPVLALLLGVFQLLSGRGQKIPYGPFLCLATATIVVLWRPVWTWGKELFVNLGWLIPALVVLCLALMAVILFLLQLIKSRFAPFESGPNALEPAAAAASLPAGESPAEGSSRE